MKPLCVVVVLLSCINVSYTCPSACSCSGNTVHCNDRNLEEIPSGIPATTQTLYLYSNQITHLNSQTFVGLSALEELLLYVNQITDISPEAFEGLSALTHLNLDSNQITYISPQAFKGLSALNDLYLTDNQITNISYQTFVGLSALKRLDLGGNQITYISPQAFEGLSALNDLYLSNNQITNIISQTFVGLSALEELYLDNNPLDCSSCDLEALKVFLNNQTHLGNVNAKCNGTNTYVVDHDFQNCTGGRTTADAMTTLVDNSANNTGSSEVGSIGAVAVVTMISVLVAYTCSVQNRKSVSAITI